MVRRVFERKVKRENGWEGFVDGMRGIFLGEGCTEAAVILFKFRFSSFGTNISFTLLSKVLCSFSIPPCNVYLVFMFRCVLHEKEKM